MCSSSKSTSMPLMFSSNDLTFHRLMRKAAKKTRQAGEKRIAPRDIRKVTMARCRPPCGFTLLMMGNRLRCDNFEDEGITAAKGLCYTLEQSHLLHQLWPMRATRSACDNGRTGYIGHPEYEAGDRTRYLSTSITALEIAMHGPNTPPVLLRSYGVQQAEDGWLIQDRELGR